MWIIVMFLSAVWTLILTAPIHCPFIDEQVMECYMSLNLFWRRNKLIYILDGMNESIFSANFHFGVNYSYISVDTIYSIIEFNHIWSTFLQWWQK